MIGCKLSVPAATSTVPVGVRAGRAAGTGHRGGLTVTPSVILILRGETEVEIEEAGAEAAAAGSVESAELVGLVVPSRVVGVGVGTVGSTRWVTVSWMESTGWPLRVGGWRRRSLAERREEKYEYAVQVDEIWEGVRFVIAHLHAKG